MREDVIKFVLENFNGKPKQAYTYWDMSSKLYRKDKFCAICYATKEIQHCIFFPPQMSKHKINFMLQTVTEYVEKHGKTSARKLYKIARNLMYCNFNRFKLYVFGAGLTNKLFNKERDVVRSDNMTLAIIDGHYDFDHRKSSNDFTHDPKMYEALEKAKFIASFKEKQEDFQEQIEALIEIGATPEQAINMVKKEI